LSVGLTGVTVFLNTDGFITKDFLVLASSCLCNSIGSVFAFALFSSYNLKASGSALAAGFCETLDGVNPKPCFHAGVDS